LRSTDEIQSYVYQTEVMCFHSRTSDPISYIAGVIWDLDLLGADLVFCGLCLYCLYKDMNEHIVVDLYSLYSSSSDTKVRYELFCTLSL
jgi:hypothetical protein